MILTNLCYYDHGGDEPGELKSEQVTLWKAGAVAGTMTEDMTLFLR